MLYLLSFILPVPFRTRYRDDDGYHDIAWWQWRGRVFGVTRFR